MFSNKKLWEKQLKDYQVDFHGYDFHDTFKFTGEFKNCFPVYEYISKYSNGEIYKGIFYVENNKWYFQNNNSIIKIKNIEKNFLIINSGYYEYLIKKFNKNIYDYILNNVYYSINYHEKTYNKFIINLILTLKKFNLPISALAEPGKPLGFPIELIWYILSFLKLKYLII